MQETVPDDLKKARKVRVLIVDGDARVRRALRRLIECAPDLTVVGEARSTPSATRLDLELLPDVVVLDLLPLQVPQGMQVLRQLRGRAARWSPSADWGSWDPQQWWPARTRSWRSTAGTSMTSST